MIVDDFDVFTSYHCSLNNIAIILQTRRGSQYGRCSNPLPRVCGAKESCGKMKLLREERGGVVSIFLGGRLITCQYVFPLRFTEIYRYGALNGVPLLIRDLFSQSINISQVKRSFIRNL